MGLNDLISELEQNVDLLERSYSSNDDEQSYQAISTKEKLEKAKAILREEKQYRDEINSTATRIVELKRLYQEVNVIQKKKKKNISPEKRASLMERFSELEGIANERFDIGIEEDEIKETIKESVLKFNRLNGSIEEGEIEEDRNNLHKMIEELQSNEKELEELNEQNEDLDEAKEEAEKLKALIKDVSYAKVRIETLKSEHNENSEEYKKLVDEMKSMQQEIEDLVNNINMQAMSMGYTISFDENSLSIDKVDEFISLMKKEKDEFLAKKEKLNIAMNQIPSKMTDIINKYDGTLRLPFGVKVTSEEFGKISEKAFETAIEKIKDNHEKFVNYRRDGYAMNNVKKEIGGTANGKQNPTDRKDKDDSKASPKPDNGKDKNDSKPETKPVFGGNAKPPKGNPIISGGLNKNKPDQNLSPKFEPVANGKQQEEKNDLPAKKQGLFSRLFSKNNSTDKIQEAYEKPQSMEVFLMQNDDKINAKDGKVSFFDVEEKNIVRKERDLAYYVENPSKALDKSIDGIRKRMIALYGKKELKKICDDMKKENGGKDTEFTKIMSSNIIKSGVASFKFRSREELDGKLKDPTTWQSVKLVENQIKVAMALDSAMTPEEVCEILKAPDKAYSNHEADLNYVTVKGKFPLSRAKAVEYKKSKLEQMYEGKTELRLGIETKFDENGKLIVSFEDEKHKDQQRNIENQQERN